MNNTILRRHTKDLAEERDEEMLLNEAAKNKDVLDFLLIMAGVDPEEEQEEVENNG